MTKPAKTGTDRKKAQRERDRTQKIKRIEIRLPAHVVEHIERICQVRGGVSGPYEMAEYLETLVMQDKERLDLHLAQLSKTPCGKCGATLPGGCGGVHKGDGQCLHTREEKQLLLREPIRFTINDF